MDKFINATHLIQTLEDTKLLIDNSPVSAFQKTVCKMTLNGAIQYMQEEMAAGGEFHRVIHAHWIEHFEDFGESFFVECSALNARLVILAKILINQSFVLTVELLWTRRLSNGESSFTSWVWTFI